MENNYYNIDIGYPLSIAQGFMIAISNFDKKLSGEWWIWN